LYVDQLDATWVAVGWIPEYIEMLLTIPGELLTVEIPGALDEIAILELYMPTCATKYFILG